MNYKTYAEAKIANPDSEIVTTNKRWSGCDDVVGYFEKRMKEHQLGDDAWIICNPADHCSSLKEFLEAGLALCCGDIILDESGSVNRIVSRNTLYNKPEDCDGTIFILSASALLGCRKIPAKVDQWTVYSNTLPLCELTDEQAGMLFNAWRGGAKVELLADDGSWRGAAPDWSHAIAYRIKPKSEREMFIDKSVGLMTSETERTMEQMFGAQFDAGARYKDLTQHFGENI